MCRWMAYTGSPLLMEDLLYVPENSLIVQSLHAHLGVEPTNGDGFGVGWYGEEEPPGGTAASSRVERPEPAGAGGAHPFAPRAGARARVDRDAGAADQLPPLPARPVAVGAQRRDRRLPEREAELALAVDPELFPDIEGSTDSELFFYLALTFGLEDDPPAAVARAVGLIEDVGRRHGEQFPMQMTVATTDGETPGRSGTPARAGPARCSTAPTSPRCARSTRTTRCCTGCRTTPGSSSPSRSAGCGGLRRRCPRARVVVRNGQEEQRRSHRLSSSRPGEPPHTLAAAQSVQPEPAVGLLRCPRRGPTLGVEEEFFLLWPDGRTPMSRREVIGAVAPDVRPLRSSPAARSRRRRGSAGSWTGRPGTLGRPAGARPGRGRPGRPLVAVARRPRRARTRGLTDDDRYRRLVASVAGVTGEEIVAGATSTSGGLPRPRRGGARAPGRGCRSCWR